MNASGRENKEKTCLRVISTHPFLQGVYNNL